MAAGDESAPSERGPLLGEQNGSTVEEGTVARHDGADESGNAPIAKDPSTKELLAIMAALWLGSFMAALGAKI